MVILERQEPGKLILLLNSTFTFADHDIFRSVMAKITAKASPIISLDMKELEYADAAAVGMLLIAFERANMVGVDLIIENITEELRLACQTYGVESRLKLV